MTAKEALEASKANAKPDWQRYLDWCLVRVKNATKAGEYQVFIDGFWLGYGINNEKVIRCLRGLGYKVSESWWGRGFTIVWGPPTWMD